jgi:signal transduction histidine kinase
MQINKATLTSLAHKYRRQMLTFGTVLFINYPLYYIVWLSIEPQGFENIAIRVVASLLCVPLIFNQFWPKKILHLLPIYWGAAACFCLPFFFTYMTLMNHGSTLWLMNVVSALFFVLLLFDLRTSLLILFVGTLSGYLAFAWSHAGSIEIVSGTITVNQVFATLFASLIIGGLFARNKQLIEQVRIRALKIEEANQIKTEFLYNMRHDIRTPFSGILGLSQAMLENETNPEKKENLTMISYSAEKLLLYLNEILEFMELESGHVPIFLKPFDLHELINSMTDIFKASIHNKNIILKSSYIDLPDWLIGDRFRIQRILINLISNSIKFTEKGLIAVSAYLIEENNNKLLVGLSVEDTGIGISKDKHTIIFEKFEKIGSSYDASNKGVGLGLHAVKSLVADLGGEVFVKSKLGEGAKFSCIIPFKKPLVFNADFLKKVTGSETQNILNLSGITNKTKILHVLLIEDSRIAQIAALNLLESLGMSIDVVDTGDAGFEQYKQKKYDFVLLDIGLPDRDGYSVAKMIRKFETDNDRTPIPIIVLTAHVDDELYRKNKPYIDLILKKPLDKGHIISIRNKLLK